MTLVALFLPKHFLLSRAMPLLSVSRMLRPLSCSPK